MALIPECPEGSGAALPIRTFADLQRAVARAPYDRAAAVAVRDFMAQAHYHRQVTREEAVALPPGVHFTLHQRVGDETKDIYLSHVREMFAGGFIDPDERDARIAALMLARTREEMDFLIQDLPGIAKELPPPPPAGQESPRPLLAFLVTLASGLGAAAVLAGGTGTGNLAGFIVLLIIAVTSAALWAASLGK